MKAVFLLLLLLLGGDDTSAIHRVSPSLVCMDTLGESGSIRPSPVSEAITLPGESVTNEREDENKESDSLEIILMVLTGFLGLLAVLTPVIISGVQQQTKSSQEFQSCSKSLYSENPIEQASAAILLRSFLKKKHFGFFTVDYSREAKNLMVALLKRSISSSLQKTIADGFSYVDSLTGQDLQYINILDASIKPYSRIQYEMARQKRNNTPSFFMRLYWNLRTKYYKKKRISMKSADLFHAVIQGCNINQLDASDSVFMYAMLCSTSFRNCILKDANFQCSNVSKVRFDEDCVLEGASFMSAIGLDTATVKIGKEKQPLLEFLDKDGIFHKNGVEEKYIYSHEKPTVFVSKLGVMDSRQNMRFESLKRIINELGDLEFISIERENYPNVSQLVDVCTQLEKCDGCIILAFEYLEVTSGFVHGNVIGEDCQEVKDKAFSSPWLHIETALANGRQMPCLIVYDSKLCRDGMFDEAIVKSDENLLAIPYSDTLSPKNVTLVDWFGKVTEYQHCK